MNHHGRKLLHLLQDLHKIKMHQQLSMNHHGKKLPHQQPDYIRDIHPLPKEMSKEKTENSIAILFMILRDMIYQRRFSKWTQRLEELILLSMLKLNQILEDQLVVVQETIR